VPVSFPDLNQNVGLKSNPKKTARMSLMNDGRNSGPGHLADEQQFYPVAIARQGDECVDAGFDSVFVNSVARCLPCLGALRGQ
jgi:hypothetical protein